MKKKYRIRKGSIADSVTSWEFYAGALILGGFYFLPFLFLWYGL